MTERISKAERDHLRRLQNNTDLQRALNDLDALERDFDKIQRILANKVRKIKKLERWQERAFEAHPNIDLDMEARDD